MPGHRRANRQPPRRGQRQQGFALLIMLVMVVMGSLFTVTSQLEFVSRKYSRDEATFRALKLAKEALIGYAVTYRDKYGNSVFGYLPCPDTVGNGLAPSSCGTAGQAAVGMLPYQTLGLPDLRDSDGICLWYAIAGTLKYPNQTDPPPSPPIVNWDTQGQFSIAGTSAAPNQGDGGAVAVIFAAGAPLDNQRSRAGSNYQCNITPTQFSLYLDDATYDFSNPSYAASSPIVITPGIVRSKDSSGNDIVVNNDQIAWITPKEIFDKIVARVDFSNQASATPVGQINKLTEEIKTVLERNIQDDVVNGSSTAMPVGDRIAQYAGPPAKQVGRLPTSHSNLLPAVNSLNGAYAGYYDNWNEQYRLVTCTNLTSPCLTVAGETCRGALMFGGRAAAGQNNSTIAPGQPRRESWKTPANLATYSPANLAYYFESGSGLDILSTNATSISYPAFAGTTFFSAANPSTDVGVCLVPGSGVIDSFNQDIATYTTKVTSAVRPEASINVGAKTVALGNTTATAAGSGCAWFPTQLPFNSLLRAYYKFNITNSGEGFIYTIVDGPTNQTAMSAGTLCGTTTSANYAQFGYSSTSPGILPPKFGLEIDTRTSAAETASPCGALARNDPAGGTTTHAHMAFVYWGAASATTSANWQIDDNCHGSTAGVLGSGSEPLNPRTLSASATTPATNVATVSSASWANNVVVVNTAAAHGQSSRQQVTISGISPSGYNGTYPIVSSAASSFAYSLATNPGTYVSGGTVATYAGIKNVQSGDTMLPYNGTLPLATDFHVRIDVTKSYGATLIKSATCNSVTGTATITTASAHGLQASQMVTTSGYTVSPGPYLISNVTSTSFDMAGVTCPGAYVSGGSFKPPLGRTVSAASAAAAGSAWNVTLTTSAAHGFISGQPVTIAGVTPAAYNGTFRVLQVPGHPNQVMYALAANPGAFTSGAGSSVTPAIALTLKAYVATNFPSCTLTDFQNLAKDLSSLCPQNPSIEQDNVYINANAVTGTVLDTVYSGFINGQTNAAASNQSLTISNFVIRTQ